MQARWWMLWCPFVVTIVCLLASVCACTCLFWFTEMVWTGSIARPVSKCDCSIFQHYQFSLDSRNQNGQVHTQTGASKHTVVKSRQHSVHHAHTTTVSTIGFLTLPPSLILSLTSCLCVILYFLTVQCLHLVRMKVQYLILFFIIMLIQIVFLVVCFILQKQS